VDIFVYPYGVKSPEAVKALRDAGYRYAFTIDSGMMSLPSAGGDAVYSLPRYMITRGSSRFFLDRIAREAGRGTQVIAENDPEKKPVSSPVETSLSVKPEKRPEPAVEMTGASVVYRDRYRDYGRKKSGPIINLDLKGPPAEIIGKTEIWPGENYGINNKRGPGRESVAVAGKEIVESSGYRGIYASHTTGIKASMGNRVERETDKEGNESVLSNVKIKLKSSYKKAALSSYRYYSLWIERIRIKLHGMKKKIEKLIDRIFT
jgi:hypothetical protein